MSSPRWAGALSICLLGGVAWLGGFSSARADEATRRAQEELRHRNLYFGDIDGQPSASFRAAVKRYQERKGFAETGQIDAETAKSLNLPIAEGAPAVSSTPWPDVPVLKSDVARTLSGSAQAALQERAVKDPSPPASLAPPADAPPSLNGFSIEEITKLVEAYLRDAAGDAIEPQVKYYQFPVEYFDDGSIDRDGVTLDTRNYCKRWPIRKYGLTGPVTCSASNRADEIFAQFTIDFAVRNTKHSVNGRARNFWTIVRRPGGDLKIVAIREERLRN
jgi:peptidoglycan hydrolase-like protein with peptidoglycan-binding domain